MWQRDAVQVVKHGRAFVKHVVPAILRPARTLWNEVIGFLFLSFGTIFAFRTITYIREHDLVRAGFMAGGTLIFVFYGISSFRKARRISRS